jgi:hypothetical protein
MNKILSFLLVFLLGISFVFAVGTENSGNLEAGSDGPDSIVQGNLDSENENSYGSQNQVEVQTMNQGESSKLKVQKDSEFGSTIQSGNSEAKTSMNVSQGEDGKTYAGLSNGKNAEIKIMPDSASEKALGVLNAKCEESGCKIELREVGKGEETKAAYEVQAKKEVKVLGMFKSQMKVKAEVDAESGEVIKTKNAWWGFLAKKN